MKKEKNNFAELLQHLSLNDEEQVFVNIAIHQLIDEKEREDLVIRSLIGNFRPLALQQKLSPQGLQFFTELVKPNFKDDISLWLPFWLGTIH
ncbi:MULTISPECIES: hypothetical protein [Leuconostoc]|uniref:Bacteriocin immunity protein n=1 Tax=Leuconostoc pseudomesenteroides TaxID=33968 RepID=A0A5B8T2L2_LEUPS|nr:MULTISPECIES: hypothetical protein [Leuconostoc]MCC8439418.1 hypothetical protein [Leuconostoc pseudomesenteroides]MDG9733439.1 hypothetical protein [Leuconostoc pseudomesenteroides]MDN2450954.1 hypothetical protein [Leuconostoc sp. UCMA20149]NKZ36118.1 hypothetical protein [Leuconostoc pseudomesenteroides]QEA42644.1 hypothetical protein FGL85_09105 [Leuconostoc pseudomesenteroides]